jgi:hypothetical protein
MTTARSVDVWFPRHLLYTVSYLYMIYLLRNLDTAYPGGFETSDWILATPSVYSKKDKKRYSVKVVAGLEASRYMESIARYHPP